MYLEFKQKQALIIGGSSGIGRAVAQILLTQGAIVTIVGRNLKKLQATAADLEQHGSIHIWQADISDRHDVIRLIEQIASQLPNVNYLVNAAGIFEPKSFLDHSEADYDRYLNLNHGIFFATQQVVRIMRDNSDTEDLTKVNTETEFQPKDTFKKRSKCASIFGHPCRGIA